MSPSFDGVESSLVLDCYCCMQGCMLIRLVTPAAAKKFNSHMTRHVRCFVMVMFT